MFMYCICAGIVYLLILGTTEVKGAFKIYDSILNPEGFVVVAHVGPCGGTWCWGWGGGGGGGVGAQIGGGGGGAGKVSAGY